MLYPANLFDKLGFTEIKALLKKECSSIYGQEFVDNIRFITNFQVLDRFLRQTAEFKNLLSSDESFPFPPFADVRGYLQKLNIENAWLSEEELQQLQSLLSGIFPAMQYLHNRQEVYPNLFALLQGLKPEKTLLKIIDKVLDDKGKVRNNASSALQSIHAEMSTVEREAQKRIQQLFKQAKDENWIAGANLTIRDGRLVIPMLAEHKRKIKGYMLDESATGQTVFIEPAEVFELNNRLRDLEFERRREIIRILTEVTAALQPYSEYIEGCCALVARMDFVRAKALFAVKTESSFPILKDKPGIRLIGAKHPLLYLNHKEQQLEVVPLNIALDAEQRIVLISGPNAGGKSVAMKTLGLLQLMLQCGLLIPADGHSEVGLFQDIMADIGDDQSIESDLSTYSAHLSKMRHFMEHGNAKSLILIDEFGTGTDPQFGGPIAEAVLEVLNSKKVSGVITTHYSNLKEYAQQTEGIENASMLFDSTQLKPLYLLETGKPGSSYAFEIAQKIGFRKEVLQLAREKTGENRRQSEQLLVQLEKERKQLSDQKQAINQQKQALQRLIDQNKQQESFFKENKNQLLRKAKEEAREVLADANKKVENAIQEIRDTQATKESIQKAKSTIAQQKEQLLEKAKVEKSEAWTIQVGDWVKIAGTESIGQVIQLHKKQVTVAIGDLLSIVKPEQLQKTSAKESKASARSNSGNFLQQQSSQFQHTLDLRGKNVSEALFDLEKHLDRALMLGLKELQILHGKGDGILRKVIREYLSKFDAVAHFGDEHADRGGAGITLVQFKD